MFDSQFLPGHPLPWGSIGPIRPPWYNRSLIGILTNLGLTTNLKLAIDAGMYDGSGSVSDLAGVSQPFSLNIMGYAGTPGGLSINNYFDFETFGNDSLNYSAANETWMNNIHKNSAIFTIIMWAYRPSNASFDAICGTRGPSSGSNIGFVFQVTSAHVLRFDQRNGPTNDTVATGSTLVPDSQWVMLSVTCNEATGANGITFGVNNTFQSFTSTYSSPTASNATSVFSIGLNGVGGGDGWPGSSRFGMVMAWEGTALNTTQLGNIYTATRTRWGV